LLNVPRCPKIGVGIAVGHRSRGPSLVVSYRLLHGVSPPGPIAGPPRNNFAPFCPTLKSAVAPSSCGVAIAGPPGPPSQDFKSPCPFLKIHSLRRNSPPGPTPELIEHVLSLRRCKLLVRGIPRNPSQVRPTDFRPLSGENPCQYSGRLRNGVRLVGSAAPRLPLGDWPDFRSGFVLCSYAAVRPLFDTNSPCPLLAGSRRPFPGSRVFSVPLARLFQPTLVLPLTSKFAPVSVSGERHDSPACRALMLRKVGEAGFAWQNHNSANCFVVIPAPPDFDLIIFPGPP